jgi:plasmid stabilization system protein ParE
MRERFLVKIAQHAEIDLDEIWSHIAADSVNNANRFILKLERRMKTLAWSPRRCSLIPENEILGTRYRHLIVGKYRAVFRISDDTVYILRVIHGARLLDTSIIED